MFPLAVLSDIHGNSLALEVVLEDLYKRGVKNMVNLGDTLWGPLDPKGTAELLIPLNMITVGGNQDRQVYEEIDPNNHTLNYMKESLGEKEINWLRSLNPIETIDDQIIMFHGTFEDDHQYFLHGFVGEQVKLRSNQKIETLLKGRNEKLILCGHDHLPNIVKLESGKIVLNPGSVGMPAYTDDIPVDHYIENGNPYTRYSIIYQVSENEYLYEHIVLNYDFLKASEMAAKNKRDDWANWVKTCRAY